MIDFIKLFFASLRASLAGLRDPAPAAGVRCLQWTILACFVVGTISFASSVFLVFKFNGVTATWFWMLVAGGIFWTISACLGDFVSRITDDVHA